MIGIGKPGWRTSSGTLLASVSFSLLVVVFWGGEEARGDDRLIRFFEREVRPLLSDRCGRCHGSEEQSSGLRLDSREALLRGGERGPAIVPGEPSRSLLIRAARREGGLEMPPSGSEKLTPRQIEILEHWVEAGAAWPSASPSLAAAASPRRGADDHWSFRRVVDPAIPRIRNRDWPRGPMDCFVLAGLEAAGLGPSDEADRGTLIRRAWHALTGLPPSPEAVASFLADEEPNAYERLVDRLLSSPRFGEHAARHWLDVARYSDTKGYVYAREERFWSHAWPYRDWVVSAFNADLRYDRFLLLQIAADQVGDRHAGDLAAMGFLTLGRRFLGVKHDIIDDRIDVVCRGTMGLTVGCARCHDHKYDPIPTADYYSLYGVFDSCVEKLERLGETVGSEAFESELRVRQEKLRVALASHRSATSQRVRDRVGDYLRAQLELEKYPPAGFDQIFEETDLLPSFVRRWEAYLRSAKLRGDPIFVHWHAFAEIPAPSFARRAARLTRALAEMPADSINPIVSRAFADPPGAFDDVIDRYARIFSRVDARWKSELERARNTNSPPPTRLADLAEERLRRVLHGPGAACEVPDEGIVHVERFFDTASCTALWKLRGQLDRWIIRSDGRVRFALTLRDRPTASTPRIFHRGNPLRPADEVPRRFLGVLADGRRESFRHGSGRLELAQAIIDPANPLTARVIVNRVWARCFGEGLVSTPSDFGARADPPSHPRLLDWLASRLVAEGWSLKRLYRRLLLSATFRQSSAESASRRASRAWRIDPANRLHWRANRRRLTFEEFRDSLLAVSGELDVRLGGKPTPLFERPLSRRRTLYGLVDRQFLPSLLRTFDFANPDLHIPRRSETTVPQQALFFLNHPVVWERARALSRACASRVEPTGRVKALFERVYQRPPTAAEIAESLELVREARRPRAGEMEMPLAERSATVDDWQYGYGAYDERDQRVRPFSRLPHFTGTAWQGGVKWPDRRLGWVQLTAAGGHPGNDRAHAAVRRWIAPRSMTVRIRSRLEHDAEPGDGVRAFLTSSSQGLLASASVHAGSAKLDADTVAVRAGEVIDFVVDIGEQLNNDQFLWTAAITEDGNAERPASWDSAKDFPLAQPPRLTEWEQLAQVLLCTNEFFFVD